MHKKLHRTLRILSPIPGKPWGFDVVGTPDNSAKYNTHLDINEQQNLCVTTCVRIHIYACVYMDIYMDIHISIYVHIYIYTYVHRHTFIHVCAYISVHMCSFLCIYALCTRMHSSLYVCEYINYWAPFARTKKHACVWFHMFVSTLYGACMHACMYVCIYTTQLQIPGSQEPRSFLPAPDDELKAHESRAAVTAP